MKICLEKWDRKKSEHSEYKGRRTGAGFDLEIGIKKAWLYAGKL